MCAACISGDASPEAKGDMLSQGESSETSNSKKGPKDTQRDTKGDTHGWFWGWSGQ